MAMEGSVLQKLQANKDLFGGSSSEEDSDGDSSPEPSLPPQRPRTPSEAASSEDEIFPPPKARQRKKRSSTPKAQKPKKSEVHQIYSDNQRSIRESSLNLPKYQPRVKTLDSFLSRVKSRQPLLPSSSHKPSHPKTVTSAKSLTKSEVSNMRSSIFPVKEPITLQPLVDKENSMSNGTANTSPNRDKVSPSHEETGAESAPPLCNDFASKEKSVSKSPVLPDEPSSKVQPPKAAVKQRKGKTTQRTLTSIFAAKPKPQASWEEQPKQLDTPTPDEGTTRETTPPKLAGDEGEEQTICLDIPEPELTDMERFRLRLSQHLKTNPRRSRSTQERGVANILSKETIVKAGDTPGALREQWKLALQRQVSHLSKARAEEQRALEESRKKYEEEEFGEEEEEILSDEEFTDSSDEEFVDGSVAGGGEESDMCSDLDQEEGQGAEEGSHGSRGTLDSDSDDEGVNSSHLGKRKAATILALDSDEESDVGGAGEESDVEGEEKKKVEGSGPGVLQGVPRSLVDPMEGSMPPLRLDSIEDTNSPFSLDSDSQDRPAFSPAYQPSQDQSKTKLYSHSAMDSGIGPSQLQSEGEEEEEDEREGEEGGEKKDDGSLSMATDADSLEFSFQWGQSLPPAQPVNPDGPGPTSRPTHKPSLLHSDTMDTMDILGEESQWQATPTTRSEELSQDADTQFLDEDGFLCIRKEKVTSPGDALREAMDSSSYKDHSPSELLQLCSGKFPDTSPVNGKPSLGSKVGGDTQAVRELLGLEPGMKVSLDTQEPESDDDDVVGLCSGLFPSSQTQLARNGHTQLASSFSGSGCAPSSSRTSRAGASDGVSSDEASSSEGEGEGVGSGDDVVMRWVQRQQNKLREGGVVAVSRAEGGDVDMPVIKRRKVHLKQTKGERLAEFVESEAELSGEDVGSDLDEEDLLYKDEYEEEEGLIAGEEVAERELWDQVNKAHLKHTLADDKADLRDLKERFLKEGDLYEDGLMLKNGFFRTRHFAGQSSEAGSLELFSEERESGGEGEGEEEGNSLMEAKRRRDRIEREEFIRKCKEKDAELLDEDSQAILSIITDTTSQPPCIPTQFRDHGSQSLGAPPTSRRQSHTPRCSSFLKRTKTTPHSLPRGKATPTSGGIHGTTPSSARRNSDTAMVTPTNVGAVGGRGFVFQKSSLHVATAASATKNASTKKTAMKHQPIPKKPRLSKPPKAPTLSSTSTPSVFSLFK